MPLFHEDEPEKLYQYLKSFGMYTPNRKTHDYFKKLQKQDIWLQVKELFKIYKRKWNGPDIPIYIFPVEARQSLFVRHQLGKSGVSFKDKVFLFLSPAEDPKELEALFVHEYHHVCRMNKLKKAVSEYTLLDSIVLEGLAEYTVRNCCGEDYLSAWCTYYTEKEIETFWKQFIKPYLTKKKTERLHDQVLFGKRNVPDMLGYAAGYVIISKYAENHQITLSDSLTKPADEFITAWNADTEAFE
ncbi:DUF2268 domain-containing protein [Bacillus mesophilum]|uniref:DUF2268 domain-containing protein n=1 Tax=Bacillus mesophilum TaxID=1071718 RepID=A0A7V7RJ93_9BACI|nr:DUF2268 domain-containing protein [Bacillus mesophilum]KAB2330870.1 DUF2268 domain-containing protein [Bacillus mesophilum]